MTTERRVDVAGIELAVVEAGAGGEPLMLVHGWTGSKEDFGDWMEAFADAGFHVVAPDTRGHGSSAKPESESDYSFEIYAGDVLGLASALGWDRFALLGHSMGGMIAQVAALRAPERLTSLVLMDTHHGAIEVDRAGVELAAEAARTMGTSAIADLMAAATEPGPLETEAYRRVCAERPGFFEWGIENTRRTATAMFAGMLVEMINAESRLDALSSLDVPCLVLVGDQDVPFIAASEALAAAIPGATYVVLPDGGHSPQFEAPEAWWAAMSSFLAPLTSTAR